VLERAQLPSDAEGYIEFVSLQDLKGSLYFGGEFDKLEHVQKLTWDLLIVDEAHEGVDTRKSRKFRSTKFWLPLLLMRKT